MSRPESRNDDRLDKLERTGRAVGTILITIPFLPFMLAGFVLGAAYRFFMLGFNDMQLWVGEWVHRER